MPATSEHFPAALRLLRTRARMLQSDVEKKAKIGAGKLSEYETGATTPRLESLFAILSAMNCGVRELADALDEVSGSGVCQVTAHPPSRTDTMSARLALAMKMADLYAAAIKQIAATLEGDGEKDAAAKAGPANR